MGLANRSEFLKKSKDPYRKHHLGQKICSALWGGKYTFVRIVLHRVNTTLMLNKRNASRLKPTMCCRKESLPFIMTQANDNEICLLIDHVALLITSMLGRYPCSPSAKKS